MASVGSDPNGRRRILFVAADGSRKTVRLGKCSARDAEGVARHVEALAASSINGQPIPRETAVWLARIGDVLHDRLARAGLVADRNGRTRETVATFCDKYLDQRKDLKPSTITAMKQSRVWLVRFLGDDRQLQQVTIADADAYVAHMHESGLAKATVAKRCRYARHFFDIAKRRGLVAENPFSHIKGAVKGNPARRAFVPAETVQKVIDAIPCPQWKLMVALARWGGLRCPSEVLALTWRDVDFAGPRFIVRASKTEHHADAGIRIVPMFPELVEHFQACFDAAEEGDVRVITRYRPGDNVRMQFTRYIEQAGVKPWPKLWQNLRASRATELADLFPSHVAAAWLGHTERIADSFYRTVTDTHFERATGGAARNPAQQVPAMCRIESQVNNSDAPKRVVLQALATGCEKLRKGEMGGKGLEPLTLSV